MMEELSFSIERFSNRPRKLLKTSQNHWNWYFILAHGFDVLRGWEWLGPITGTLILLNVLTIEP